MPKTLPNYSYKLNQTKKGTQEELEEYVMSFMPKIKHIISRLNIDEKYYNDFVQAGLLGVIEAIKIYDNEKPFPFSIFLHQKIIAKIQETAKGLAYLSGLNYCDSIDELAVLLNSDMFLGTQELGYNNQDTDYFDVSDDDITGEVEPQIYSIMERHTEEQALELADFATIITYLSWLDERTQFVIIHSFGLFGNAPKNQRDIGLLLNISHTTVGQIYEKGIRRIKTLCQTSKKHIFKCSRIRHLGQQLT